MRPDAGRGSLQSAAGGSSSSHTASSQIADRKGRSLSMGRDSSVSDDSADSIRHLMEGMQPVPLKLVARIDAAPKGGSTYGTSLPTEDGAREAIANIARGLRRWQPLANPWVVLGCYFGGSALLLSTGCVLVFRARAEPEDVSVDYTDRHAEGWVDLEVREDLEAPIFLYYALSGRGLAAAARSRAYTRSRDDRQLLGSGRGPPRLDPAEIKACDPWAATDGRVNYPCGLVAKGVFTDHFALHLRQPEASSWSLLTIDSSSAALGIHAGSGARAGEAVSTPRFRNIDPEARPEPGAVQYQVLLRMWLLELFPPVRCEQVDFSSEPYRPARVAIRYEADADGNQVEVVDCADYMSDAPRCNFTRDGHPFTCDEGSGYEQVIQPSWGVESGHFMTWMTPQGLSGVIRRPWARIDHSLPRGSTVRVSFSTTDDWWPAQDFGGRKALLLSTVPPAEGGSRAEAPALLLGSGYVVCGLCCALAGVRLLGQHMQEPHPLKRVNRLTWGGSAAGKNTPAVAPGPRRSSIGPRLSGIQAITATSIVTGSPT